MKVWKVVHKKYYYQEIKNYCITSQCPVLSLLIYWMKLLSKLCLLWHSLCPSFISSKHVSLRLREFNKRVVHLPGDLVFLMNSTKVWVWMYIWFIFFRFSLSVIFSIFVNQRWWGGFPEVDFLDCWFWNCNMRIKVMNFGQIWERSVLFLIIIDLKAGLLFLFLLKLGYIQ